MKILLGYLIIAILYILLAVAEFGGGKMFIYIAMGFVYMCLSGLIPLGRYLE